MLFLVWLDNCPRLFLLLPEQATTRPSLSRKQILVTLLEGKNIHLGKDTQDLDLDDLQIGMISWEFYKHNIS